MCGNHDEFFYKLINAKNIIRIKDKELNLKQNPLQDLLFTSGKNIAVSGLKRWMEIGGGYSTIKDYCPQIKNEIEKIVYDFKNENDLKRLNFLMNIFQNSIPKSHKFFFNKLINNLYYIIDDFLIIHAGIFPNKKLIDQGIGKNAPKLDELNFLKLIMIRDEFLWAKKLNNCKHYIVHGHTPSERLKNNSIIPYTHNNFRLCLDTKVYAKNGSLTCFFKYDKKKILSQFQKKIYKVFECFKMNKTNLKVGYVGMSHLGINSAVATAEKGASVYCFDEDKKLIDDLNKLNINIDEPDLIEKLSLFKNRINFTSTVNDLDNCDLIFISKDVKTDENGNSDLSEVNNLIDIINNEINDNIILIILCQVPPGFTRKINRNKDYLYYQVETLIFGRAIERALNPERIILGVLIVTIK